MAPGSQDYARDPQRGPRRLRERRTYPRAEPKVSVFDAGFTMGDGIWKDLRPHKGRLLFREEHRPLRGR